jgi:hypothetical protein
MNPALDENLKNMKPTQAGQDGPDRQDGAEAFDW